MISWALSLRGVDFDTLQRNECQRRLPLSFYHQPTVKTSIHPVSSVIFVISSSVFFSSSLVCFRPCCTVCAQARAYTRASASNTCAHTCTIDIHKHCARMTGLLAPVGECCRLPPPCCHACFYSQPCYHLCHLLFLTHPVFRSSLAWR